MTTETTAAADGDFNICNICGVLVRARRYPDLPAAGLPTGRHLPSRDRWPDAVKILDC